LFLTHGGYLCVHFLLKMKPVSKISRNITAGKILSAVTMMLLLLFLTCVNQFVYGSSQADVAASWNCNEEDPGPGYPNGGPAGPDEKSPDAPVSINEELIHFHETHESPFWANALFEHRIHQSDKLCVVHFEILSPPPNA
jgi:hypothetical protein